MPRGQGFLAPAEIIAGGRVPIDNYPGAHLVTEPQLSRSPLTTGSNCPGLVGHTSPWLEGHTSPGLEGHIASGLEGHTSLGLEGLYSGSGVWASVVLK